ncbi:MAG TPA: flavoprotein [Methylocella sp.]|nr:flavoprotein [Methylocella sp.]
MSRVITPRWGWAFTGSGHYFNECIELARSLEHVDIFISKAAAEVMRQYKQKLDMPKTARIYRDTSASSPEVGYFYHGVYHTLVVAPATSNIVAKFVYGISDNLVSNVFAQAGKCKVQTIVFACDTAPELLTRSPDGMVKVFPRRIDLDNTEKLKTFEATEVAESLGDLRASIARRQEDLKKS